MLKITLNKAYGVLKNNEGVPQGKVELGSRIPINKSRGCFYMKKKGITLLEVIITMSIMLLIMSLVYPIFLSGSKNLIKSDMETTLQMDATAIENKITEILTQSKGIESVFEIENVNSSDTENIVLSEEKNSENIVNNIGKLEVKVPKDEDIDNDKSYIFKLERVDRRDNKNIYSISIDDGQPLSKYVEAFSIESMDDKKLVDAIYVKVKINLYYKKGITVVEHPIESIITFRNK